MLWKKNNLNPNVVFCLILFGLISTEAEGEQHMW